MCGIFGIISARNRINIESITDISSQIKHRGPDDEGYLLFNASDEKALKGPDSPISLDLQRIGKDPENFTSAFLHRRLSIIDLSDSGHQPMSYAGGRYWIILNGEIYNYIEIKSDLIKMGYSFHSTSDTEVVMAAYEEWGDSCVVRFNGMWAFALYDRQEQTIFCSRDRLGVKPFYYSIRKGRLLFCSEMKGIRAYMENTTTLNDNKIREYLIRSQVVVGADKETIFQDIYQLMPGHNLTFEIQTGKLKTSSYWRLNLRRDFSGDKKFYIENFKELFKDSLKLRLRSDVEVGSCLSGGLDSSSIVCFASKEFNKTFHTFSAIWPGFVADESRFMDIVNEHIKSIKHYTTYDLTDFLDLHDIILYHQEIPMEGSSLIAQWLVMKEARRNRIKVLLDGQGADEILGGYPGYVQSYIVELYRLLLWKEFTRNRVEWNTFGYNYRKIVQTIFYRNKVILKNLLSRRPKYNTPNLPIIRSELGIFRIITFDQELIVETYPNY